MSYTKPTAKCKRGRKNLKQSYPCEVWSDCHKYKNHEDQKEHKNHRDGTSINMTALARAIAQEARLAYCERRKRMKKVRVNEERKRKRNEQVFLEQGGLPVVECLLHDMIKRLERQEEEEHLSQLRALEDAHKATVRRLALLMESDRVHPRSGDAATDENTNHSGRVIEPFNLSELKTTSPTAKKRLSHLIATRGWTLICSKNHLKYSRRVSMNDGRMREQIFCMSKSPSDFRARQGALRDLIALEANVRSIH